MRKEYDTKFKEMIVQKHKSGEKVSKLAIDYDVKRGQYINGFQNYHQKIEKLKILITKKSTINF